MCLCWGWGVVRGGSRALKFQNTSSPGTQSASFLPSPPQYLTVRLFGRETFSNIVTISNASFSDSQAMKES